MEGIDASIERKFFIEDSKRITMRTFLEWVAHLNKGLSAIELLKEFEH